jgi:hypothetical protein
MSHYRQPASVADELYVAVRFSVTQLNERYRLLDERPITLICNPIV